MANIERTIVELQVNCVEGSKGDIVAMDNDMVKAYGKSMVEVVKNEDIEKDLEKNIAYAEKNGISIPKTIHVERFAKRIEATKAAIKAKAEREKAVEGSAELKAELEAEKEAISQERAELEAEKEAFEKIKADFAQEKVDFEAEVDAHYKEVEAFEKQNAENKGEEKTDEAPKEETKETKKSK